MGRRTLYILMCLVLVIGLLLGACAKPASAPAPTPAPAPKPTPAPAPPPESKITRLPSPPPKAQAPAESITLTMVSAFGKQTSPASATWKFVELVDRWSNGQMKIEWKGASEVIPTFDQPEALVSGVFDIWQGAPNYFNGIVPSASAGYMSPWGADEQGPGTPIYEFKVDRWEEHGARLLFESMGPPGEGNFYMYLNKMIERPQDVKGLKIRVAPHTKYLALALDAEPITLPGGDIYMAMERNTVDGFIWPIEDSFNEMGWPEVTKYIVNHSVFRGILGFAMNLDKWNSLDPFFQDVILQAGQYVSIWREGFAYAGARSQHARALEAGVQDINFSEADAEWYVNAANEALLQSFADKMDPNNYAKLREIYGLD